MENGSAHIEEAHSAHQTTEWALPPQPPSEAIVPPTSVTNSTALGADDATAPIPVLQVLSPRGIEYAFMTISLFVSAGGLLAVLLALVNGQAGFQVLSFPVSALLVSLPVFAWLFLRLKKAELADPALKHDVSKRRNTQFTQIVTFVVCLFTFIGVVTAVLAKLGGQYDTGIAQVLLNGVVILLVAGGILAYYWHDEHRGK